MDRKTRSSRLNSSCIPTPPYFRVLCLTPPLEVSEVSVRQDCGRFCALFEVSGGPFSGHIEKWVATA